MASRRFLFALWNMGGTVAPDLAVVRSLVERGHDVTVLAPRALESAVGASGGSFQPWPRAPQGTVYAAGESTVRAVVGRKWHWIVDGVRERVFGALGVTGKPRFARRGPAARMAAGVSKELERRPVHAAAVDFVLPGAIIATEAAGVPTAVLLQNPYCLPAPGLPPWGTGWPPARGLPGRTRDRVHVALTRHLWVARLPALNAARADHGLSPLNHPFEQFARADRILVMTSPSFDFPGEVPATVRYVGPQLDDPAWVEPWRSSWPNADLPLVLVALSSTNQSQAHVLRRIIDGVESLPVRVLVTVGPALDPADFAAGERVAVVRSAPHSEVLQEASVVVCHGGHGTVLKALAAGVPVLCLPMGRDQSDNAARLVATGAGLRLKPSASAAAIAAAVRTLLDEEGYGAEAARLATTLRAEMAVPHAALELELIAGGSEPVIDLGQIGSGSDREDSRIR